MAQNRDQIEGLGIPDSGSGFDKNREKIQKKIFPSKYIQKQNPQTSPGPGFVLIRQKFWNFFYISFNFSRKHHCLFDIIAYDVICLF